MLIEKISPAGRFKVSAAVAGMKCARCAARVEKAIAETGAALGAAADPAAGLVEIYTAGEPDTAVLKKAIEDAGYAVKGFGVPEKTGDGT